MIIILNVLRMDIHGILFEKYVNLVLLVRLAQMEHVLIVKMVNKRIVLEMHVNLVLLVRLEWVGHVGQFV